MTGGGEGGSVAAGEAILTTGVEEHGHKRAELTVASRPGNARQQEEEHQKQSGDQILETKGKFTIRMGCGL